MCICLIIAKTTAKPPISKQFLIKNTCKTILFLVLIATLSSCNDLSRNVRGKLNHLNIKAEHLDSLVNSELDKVKSLDAIINIEGKKINKYDSLVNKTSSKVDSIVNEKLKSL
jgi:hypothetical protein